MSYLLTSLSVFSVYQVRAVGVLTVHVCRTVADGLQMLDAFIRFIVCDPSSTQSYQYLRLSLMSTLCLKSIDNLHLIHYMLRLVPLMPVVQRYHCDNDSTVCVSVCSNNSKKTFRECTTVPSI